MAENDAQVVIKVLKSAESPTEAYIESDGQDLFLRVDGWLSPELAKALVVVLQNYFDPKDLRLAG